jgi:hypothetical protein
VRGTAGGLLVQFVEVTAQTVRIAKVRPVGGIRRKEFAHRRFAAGSFIDQSESVALDAIGRAHLTYLHVGQQLAHLRVELLHGMIEIDEHARDRSSVLLAVGADGIEIAADVDHGSVLVEQPVLDLQAVSGFAVHDVHALAVADLAEVDRNGRSDVAAVFDADDLLRLVDVSEGDVVGRWNASRVRDEVLVASYA